MALCRPQARQAHRHEAVHAAGGKASGMPAMPSSLPRQLHCSGLSNMGGHQADKQIPGPQKLRVAIRVAIFGALHAHLHMTFTWCFTLIQLQRHGILYA